MKSVVILCDGAADRPIPELGGFALHGPVTVNFSHNDKSFELKHKGVVCTRKYQTVIHHLLAGRPAMQS